MVVQLDTIVTYNGYTCNDDFQPGLEGVHMDTALRHADRKVEWIQG